LVFVLNRYYDPTSEQFLSIDPAVATTDQPYVFTNDDPLNAEDPLGMRSIPCLGTWVKESSGFVGCENINHESKASTLALIEAALSGLDLTGKETKALAEEISTKLAENGGRAISSHTANMLDAEAGIGDGLSRFAGVAGAVVTLSGDLANGDSLAYSLKDTGVQVAAGMGGGAIGAAACSWAGPGDAICAGVGFITGLLASWGAGTYYQYKYGKDAK
jgi:hypothetical protein